MRVKSDSDLADSEEYRIVDDDRRRMREVCDYLRRRSDFDAVTDVLPRNAPAEMVEAVAWSCTVDHVGCLVFVAEFDAVQDFLRELGIRPQEPVPAGVERDRLAARYRVPGERLKAGCLDLRVVQGQLSGETARAIEVHCLRPDDELDALAMSEERSSQLEHHVAVRLDDPERLAELQSALARDGGPRADGGGYDPACDVTMLRFRAEGRTEMGWPRRLEVIALGRHTEVLLRHLAETTGEAAEADDRRLLRRLTGAWGTQAVRVMVELDLAEHLSEGPLTCEELARLTGVDADRLDRLLFALCHPWIGALSPSGDGFALTALGRRLSRDAPNSMHHLALLYGELFYESFGLLSGGIKYGVHPFVTAFGRPPFEYFSDNPHQRRIFMRAMAEGSAFFADVATVVDLSEAGTVADIGGGNGELIAHLCDVYPDLTCALLDRPEVIGAARENLGSRGYLDRCALFPGSFYDSADMPIGADVYIVARILHDWDDETCVAILRAIREAASAESMLLIIERPLPDDPADPSVAGLWHLNMMVNNVGGRERTRDQYRRLLETAGFEVTGERMLRLDMTVTIARVLETPRPPSPQQAAGEQLTAR